MQSTLLARLTPLQKDLIVVIAAAGFAGDTFRALSPFQATVITGLVRLGIVVEQDQRWTLTVTEKTHYPHITQYRVLAF